jgi:hypothetical protein
MDKSEVDKALRAQLRFIYNSYRTALLSRKYYGRRLNKYQRLNSAMEWVIAVAATGSPIAGLAFWNSEIGQPVWLAVSVSAAILGTAKPILKLNEKSGNYMKLYTAYSSIFLDLRNLLESITVQQGIPDEVAKKYEAIQKLIRDIGGEEDPIPNRREVLAIQEEVNNEVPARNLWSPA